METITTKIKLNGKRQFTYTRKETCTNRTNIHEIMLAARIPLPGTPSDDIESLDSEGSTPEPIKVESRLTSVQADFIARFKIACNAPIGSPELRSLVYGV